MLDQGNFCVLRYSLVEEAQQDIDPSPLPEPKGKAVLEALKQDREFTVNSVEYALLGFRPITQKTDLGFDRERYLVGKIAKLRKAHVGEKVPGNIIEHVEDDWVPLTVVFDFLEQLIFVQRDWKFGTEKQAAGALEGGIRREILAKYNHRIFIEARTRKSDFWKIVKTHRQVYRLNLRLISPNILKTNKEAREALEELKKLYGQDEITIQLENESGNLDVPEDPITDYVEYIAEGEGSWQVVTEGVRGGKKKYSSEEQVMTLHLPAQPAFDIQNERQFDFDYGSGLPDRSNYDIELIRQIEEEWPANQND